MTQKERQEQAKMKVGCNLKLWKEHGYVRVEDSNRRAFFYKQVNPAVGVLIAYTNACDEHGKENIHYENHCFDLFICMSDSMNKSISDFKQDKESLLQFWIPSFSPYNEKYLDVVDALDDEKETNPILLNERYKKLSGRTF